MNDVPILLLSGLAGLGLGAFFFAGLWWTVRRGAVSAYPARLFVSSFLIRMTVTVGGFYLVSDGDWRRILALLLGFVVARWLILRWTRRDSEVKSSATELRREG